MEVTLKPRWVLLAPLLLALACASKPPASSPASSTASPAGGSKFVWHDLVTDDPAACQRFYGSLLGWQFAETNRLGRPYTIARAAKTPVAGIVTIKRESPDKPVATWLSYLSVPNLDGALQKAKSDGAKVLVEPVEIKSIGRAAVLRDPQGALLGLVWVSAGDPPDPAKPQPMTFFWSEYLAADAQPALSFYESLGGFTSSVAEDQGELRYFVLKGARPRAGLFRIPDSSRHVQPNWLPYVLVDDPAALAARVEGLGGRVLLAPKPEFRKGTLAIIADPTGAALALQKWPI